MRRKLMASVFGAAMLRAPLLRAPLLAALLAGCTMIPNYHRPAMPVAAQYPEGPVSLSANPQMAGVEAADLGWRDFFTDPIMQKLIALSLQNNRDLRVAALNAEAAEAQYRIQHASLFPTVDATAEGYFERVPGAEEGFAGSLHANAYSLGVGAASYELDVFGRLRSLSKQAQEKYLSAKETRLSTQISLISQVASSYLAWRADREAGQVAQNTAIAQRHSYELRKMTLNKGTGTALDVAQAESTLRTAEASLQQYTRQSAQDLDELTLLVGAPLPEALTAQMMTQVGLKATPGFPELPAGLPSQLLQRRPDIRAAEHTLLAANANIGAARAAFFPSIVLTANGGTAGGALGQLFGAGTASWLFQPQISVPIFDAGSNFANLDYSKIEKRVEIANYEKAIQFAFHDVADALAARSTYRGQVIAEQKLVGADQRYFDISKMRSDAGVDTYLNVLVAQSSLFGAQLNLIALKLAEQQNLVTLYKVLGGGWTETTRVAGR